jgi:hypothetical protein
MSIDEFANTTPVRSIVNRNTNRSAHRHAALIPVGTAIIIVADVKYARVSTSIPTVNIWCAHTTNPNNPIANIPKIIPKFPNASFLPLS